MNAENHITINFHILSMLSKYLLSIESYMENPPNNTYSSIALTRQRKFTLQELSAYNGAGGKPAYAAVNGVVYDMSLVPAWGGGTHFGLYAGKDLSSEFNKCHKLQNILTNLPKVGVL